MTVSGCAPGGEVPMFYWVMKYVLLGPFLRLLYRPKATGLENVPAEGPVILASNHLSFIDSLFIPLRLKRRVIFLGKADYFASARTRWFFKWVRVIPVKREGGLAGEAAIQAGVRDLNGGRVVAIYPEGTRSPDGRLYRGKTGVARMALLADCPVIPVAVRGTRDVQPPERRIPRIGGRVEVLYGEPLRFDRYRGRDRDRFVLRSITDEIMYEIMLLSGQEYVDEYASRVKARQGIDESPLAPTGDAVPPAPAPDGTSSGPDDALPAAVRTRPTDDSSRS